MVRAVLSRASDRAPEAFGADVLHNLVGGSWQPIGTPERLTSPVDGSELIGLPTLDPKQEAMTEAREDLALLLSWEIGKPWRLACADVDRALDGVRWYLGEIESMLDGRTPLPVPVSNIAAGTIRCRFWCTPNSSSCWPATR